MALVLAATGCAGPHERSSSGAHSDPAPSAALVAALPAQDLPLIAANLSRREAASVARGQVLTSPEPAGWGSTERAVIDQSIRAGHCDLLPEAMIEPMAAAQRARDARLAESVAAAHLRTGLPVLLLAGNGHVRRDIGVPRYLAALLPRASIIGIGLLEEGDETSPQVFDHIVRTPAAPREDPCLRLRAQAPALRSLPAQ